MPFLDPADFKRLSKAQQEEHYRSHTMLGWEPESARSLELPDADRFAGTYVLGVQGVGKSTLLENLIAHDARVGNAIIVIDPHGDLTTNCLAALPKHRLGQTYVLDMEDEAYPFGVNVFAAGKAITSIQQAQVVDRIMHVFEVLWPDVLSQAYLPRYVRAATIVFLVNPGATLVDMQRFLLDAKVRSKMLANVSDPTVKEFWQLQFDTLTPAQQQTRVQPLLGKLESLFMGRSLVRNIVGHRQTTIDFRKAIEQKQDVFIKLPVKTVEQDARLIGTFLVSQIHAAVFSFGDLPTEQRPSLSLYVDEFQHFATPDFSELFTEGRKFGVKVTVAHQYRGQLPEYLQKSTMTARTKIVFQTTPEDGREMAHFFPQEAELDPESIEQHACARLMAKVADFPPEIQTFVKTYLIPMQTFKRHGVIEIKDKQWDVNVGRVLLHGFHMENERKHVVVEDPTPYLDALFYEAMRSGKGDQSVPIEAIMGLANSGRGFFTMIRKVNHGPELEANFCFPDYLIVDDRWARPPENAREQLYHCLWHLRSTLHWLAYKPMGKTKAATPAQVAQKLAHQPKHHAMIRSGETVGRFEAMPPPDRIEGEGLAERLQVIRQLTRSKYCRPLEPVATPAPVIADEVVEDDGGATLVIRHHKPKQPVMIPTDDGWEEI